MAVTPSTFPNGSMTGPRIPDPYGHGERAVTFLRLAASKSIRPNRAFQLDPWQERIVRRIYGPRHEDGTRIINTTSGCCLPAVTARRRWQPRWRCCTIGPERKPGGGNLCLQRRIVNSVLGFREAAGIIREISASSRPGIYDAHNAPKKLIYRKDASYLEVISAMAGRNVTYRRVRSGR